jgi:hypothetical protein
MLMLRKKVRSMHFATFPVGSEAMNVMKKTYYLYLIP